MYINSTNISPIMVINRIYETRNLLPLWLVSFLVRLRTYQHPCNKNQQNAHFPHQCFNLIIVYSTCFGHPSVHPQEELYLQFYITIFVHPYNQSGQWYYVVDIKHTLLSRLTPYSEEIIEDHQCGFWRNRSTTDRIICIRQILENKWEYNEAVHQLFIST